MYFGLKNGLKMSLFFEKYGRFYVFDHHSDWILEIPK
jgi:hypothetical protein